MLRHKRYETRRLILRPSTPLLAEEVVAYYTRNKAFFEKIDPPRSEDFFTVRGQRRALRRDELDMQTKTGARFWLTLHQQQEIIGMVALNNMIMGSFCSAFLAYKLDKGYLNQGLISEAIAKVVHIAFNELGLHRLEANIMPRNTASLRVAEKLGFQNEGLSAKYLNINGVWEDHVRMVLLNEPESTAGFFIKKAEVHDKETVGFLSVESCRETCVGIVPLAYLSNMQEKECANRFLARLAEGAESYIPTLGGRAIGQFELLCGHDAGMPRSGEMTAFYLLRAHWGKGFGRKMMDFALQKCSALGCEALVVWVLKNDYRARSFCEHFAFTLDGAERQVLLGGMPVTEIRYQRKV